MAFMRRVIYFDRAGRKHVLFRSMGASLGAADPGGVHANAVSFNPGYPRAITLPFGAPVTTPDDPNEIEMPDDYVGHGTPGEIDCTQTPNDPVCVAIHGAPGADPAAAASVSGSGIVDWVKANPLTAAAVAVGAYFAFGRKKKRSA